MTTKTILPRKDDNRGAIMVIGIFMACAMIALMWYMIGLGDALIWRDRSQEAADSMAFSSAAIHAHGMNIIAFLNIVMSALVALYMLAAIIYNLTDFLLCITGRNDDSHWYTLGDNSCDIRDQIKDIIEAVLAIFTGGATAEDISNSEFCDAAKALQPFHDWLADDLGPSASGQPSHMIKNYEDKILGPVNYWAAWLQTKIANLTPWVGAAMSSYVGYEYTDRTDSDIFKFHRFGTALSPGMMKASDVDGYNISDAQRSIDWLKPSSGDPRMGLPVGEMRMGWLCYRNGKYLFSWIGNSLNGIPFVDKILKWLGGKVASAVEGWYCTNDSHGFLRSATNSPSPLYWANWLWDLEQRDPPYSFDYKGNPFWNDPKTGGPKVMVEFAQNGNDWMQTFGIVIPLNRNEDNNSEHRVGFTRGTGGGKSVSYTESQNSRDLYTEGKNAYYATAEFYLNKDCAWADFDCNDDSEQLYNATFSMKWRSRLRRVHSPAWGDEMLKWIRNKTGIPTGILNNARILKAMDFIHDYLLDDPQAKYTTAYKALQDGNKHNAKNYLEPASLVPDAMH